MIKVTCKDCGRIYDYSKDDFCPKCGSYNSPPNTDVTKLETEMLSRFDGAQKNRTASTARQAAAVKAPPRHGGPELEPKRKNPWLGVIACLLIIGIAVAGIAAWQASEGTVFEVFYSKEIKTEVHTADETISVGPFRVELDDLREIWVPEGSSLQREGYDLLAVDVYITGGSGVSKKDAVGGVYLELPSGDRLPAVDDILDSKRLKDLSEFAVDLGDALWEDPLLGSFVFYVPEGTRTAVLTLEEMKGAADKGRVTVLHMVDLDLTEAFRS